MIQQIEDHAGIECPHRLPMTRPSKALKPMVVAMLCRLSMAHMLAPWPRWATTTLPSALRAQMIRQNAGDIFVRQAVEAVAPHAFFGERARQRESRGDGRLRRMERRIEAGDLRELRVQFR